MAHRLFGPRPARSRAAPKKPAEPRLRPIADALAGELGQDDETAERNAQHIARVLKRALKRRKSIMASDRKEPLRR
jgi:hypothetical protein